MILFFSKNLTTRLFRIPLPVTKEMFVRNGPNVNQ